MRRIACLLGLLALGGCAGEGELDTDGATAQAPDAAPDATVTPADAGAADAAAPDATAAPGADAALPPLCPPGDPTSPTVAIPAGAFMMGCAPADTLCGADEHPARLVTLSAYAIDRTEVTQAAYAACVAAGACTLPEAHYTPQLTPELPVRNVAHAQAVAYCAWAGGRLPTEAEWERAARCTDRRRWPWGDAPEPDCARARVAGCGAGPAVAGASPDGASAEGALDLAGNVWEWVADWYQSDAYATSADTDPTGPVTGSLKVARGGSYATPAAAARAGERVAGVPALGYDDFGFRCAYGR